MNIQQTLIKASKILKNNKIPTASLEAEVLLAFILNKPKEYLYAYPEKELTVRQQKKFTGLINRREKAEPVAYLTKNKEFFGLNFFVDKQVLIPRPETELLVEEILKIAKNSNSKKFTIADVGTGSGCIAVALAKNLPDAKIIGTDNSAGALTVAGFNAKHNRVNVKFFRGSLLAPLKKKSINIIAANLPYGWRVWKNDHSIPAKSLKFEPPKALFTGENGLLLYRRLFEQISEKIRKPKFVVCEFDPRQAKSIVKLAKKYMPEYFTEIKEDLAGHNRILVIKKEP